MDTLLEPGSVDAYTPNLRICVARITPPQFALLSTCASPACDGLTVRYILDWTPDCELRLQRPGELVHGGNGTLAALRNGTYSALIIAAAQGHTDACTELCRNERYKEALNATSKDGSTDLHMVARFNFTDPHVPLCQMLLGAANFTKATAKDRFGNTAVDIAKQMGHLVLAGIIERHSSFKVGQATDIIDVNKPKSC